MVVIVTGGSKGIGLATARAFVQRGDRVVITARDARELQRAAGELGASDSVHTVRADVRQPADAQRIVDETVARFGGVDVLVNNAGIGRFANVSDMKIDDWRDILDTN